MKNPTSEMEGTKDYNRALLRQVEELLEQMDDQQLTTPRGLLFGGTIGQHVRHILEYHMLLLRQHGAGRINYDLRERDRRIETEVGHARATVAQCMDKLHLITEDRMLMMESELPDGGGPVAQRTSLLRELTYVADHCVHHLAMMRIVIEQELPMVMFPEELGVAAATRNHRAR
jgi:uncharacterized damage-inducible protein DinB